MSPCTRSNFPFKLENKLLFNDKIVNVQSTQGFSEKGLLKIQNENGIYIAYIQQQALIVERY